MYFIPIIVPMFVEGERRLVHSDWKRALFLLRDSLESRYGALVVAAPYLPLDDGAATEQRLETIDRDDAITLEPMFDGRIRARQFWLQELPRFRRRLAPLIERAHVVHSGLGDLYRPMMELPFLAAHRHGIPTVFVQDTDTVLQLREEARDQGWTRRASASGYSWLYERACRAAVSRADLSLLKGKALMDRYARHAHNAHEIQNTSYVSSDVIAEHALERRLTTLAQDRPLRLVYCGRLIARKGVADSISMVERARSRGARICFDIIGEGPCEAALRRQIESSGLSGAVQLRGARSYDAALLHDLAAYDAMLFSPRIEDTPRMIFDGYAAGLPLLAVGIPYVRERAAEEGATVVLPRGELSVAAEQLVGLDARRNELVPLARAARQAAYHHAAELWYARRAQWTHEAVARRRVAPPRFATVAAGTRTRPR